MKFGVTLPIKLSPAPETSPSLRKTDDASHVRLRANGFTLTVFGRVMIIPKE